MTKTKLKDTLIVGFAAFAIFFGAGNLVFPPQIGLISGGAIVSALIGLVLSGIVFPMLGFIAVNNMGSTIEDITKRGHRKLHTFFLIVTLPMGICGTFPRCGGVAYEVGLLGLFPDLPEVSRWIFLIEFFGVSFLIACNRSNIMDIIGKFITPILVVCLLIIVILSILTPIGKPEGGVVENAFTYSFLTSINTGNIATGVMCAGIFIGTLKEKGYTNKRERTQMLKYILLVAFILLSVIYCGLCYLGATGTKLFPADIDNTALLVGLAQTLAGRTGVIILSLSVILTCLTSEAGLIATMADMMVLMTNGKGNYRMIAFVITVAVTLVAFTEVSFIIKLSAPFFVLVFPFCIVLTILGIFHRLIPNDGVWKGAIFASFIVGFHDMVMTANANGLISFKIDFIDRFFTSIPLAEYGFSWIIPCLLFGCIGGIIFKVRGLESLPQTDD